MPWDLLDKWRDEDEDVPFFPSNPRGENPAYGPGNPDWERDFEKTAEIGSEDYVRARGGNTDEIDRA